MTTHSPTRARARRLTISPAAAEAAARYGDDHALIEAALAVMERTHGAPNRAPLTSPGACRDFLRLVLTPQPFESFWLVFLDAQHRLIEAREAFRGTLTQASVYPREVVKAALAANAAAVVLAHNHPSGVAEPSLQDQALTRTLAEALALVDIKVLDHFIVAGAGALSFAERGLL